MSNRDLALLGRGNSILAEKVLGCLDEGVEFYANHGGYVDYLNTRNKLYRTLADTSAWRVLYGAGGGNIAATCVRCDDVSKPHKLAVDQTLYWLGVDREEEALYYVGMLNSIAINEAIKDFQPEGNFGKRHIHTLPLAFIEEYDSKNDGHLAVAEATKTMFETIVNAREHNNVIARCLDPSSGVLHSRRRRYLDCLKQMPEYHELDTICRALL